MNSKRLKLSHSSSVVLVVADFKKRLAQDVITLIQKLKLIVNGPMGRQISKRDASPPTLPVSKRP